MPLLPRSLSWRLFCIVIGGVIVAILISNSLHLRDRAGFMAELREHNASKHFSDVISLLAPLPSALRVRALRDLPEDEWRVGLDAREEDASWEATPRLKTRLGQKLGDIVEVDGAWLERPTRCKAEFPDCPVAMKVRVRFADGQAVSLGYAPHDPERLRPPPPNKWIKLRDRDFIVIAVMAVVAWWVVRLALRPLQRMAQAAENFGRDFTHPPMAETGPLEVKRAAQAFNTMQRQIRGYMAERAQILGAVTHDLKTPMTRMRLRLENCADDALKDRLQSDLAAMHSLVEEGLELAHSLDAAESSRPVDLDALLQSLCDDAAETGQQVAYQGKEGIVVLGQPNALRRVFENIVDNAVKYGHFARVTLERQAGAACVRVCDGGPGIPEAQLDEVLKPFVRLEASRSRDTGGTGLGLAIAVNLLKSQQGKIRLRNLAQGGLEVDVSLPISSEPA